MRTVFTKKHSGKIEYKCDLDIVHINAEEITIYIMHLILMTNNVNSF